MSTNINPKKHIGVTFNSKQQALEFLENIENSKGAKIVRKDSRIEKAIRESRNK